MASRLYDKRRWRRERRAFLMAHPLCRMCEAIGRTSLATVVDHITPHKGDEALFWDHGNWEHGHTLYEELVHVPLILKLPGNQSRGTVEHVISTASILPTILELCAAPSPSIPNGAPSLAPLLERAPEAPFEQRPVFMGGVQYYEDRTAVLFETFKLIRNTDTGSVELYNLADDPGERRNLATTRPETVNRGLALLKQRALKRRAPTSAGGQAIPSAAKEELDSLGYIE